MLSSLFDKNDIELLGTIAVVIGQGYIQWKFFRTRQKDELIDSLTKTNKAKDELLEAYKLQNGRLRIHRTACKIRHEKTEQVKVDNR